MIQPLLNHDRTTRQPGRVDARAQHLNAMAMRMTMSMSKETRMRQRLSQTRVTLCQQNLGRIQAHEDTAAEEQATHAQRANAFHLAVSVGKPLARRL